MGNLKTEHQELKTILKTIKNTKEPFIIDGQQLKDAEATMETTNYYKPNMNVEHRIILKKPARLLPFSWFHKYTKFIRIHIFIKVQSRNYVFIYFQASQL